MRQGRVYGSGFRLQASSPPAALCHCLPCCPVGTDENSPAVYCWDAGAPEVFPQSPVGTTENGPLRFNRPYGTDDVSESASFPSDKSLGYCRATLRVEILSLAILLGLLATGTGAQDTVYLSSTTGAQGYTKLSGRVEDYTGRQLVLVDPNGQKRSYAAEKVLKVLTQHDPRQVEADRLMARGEYASAVALYSQARSADSRTWVRRQITAQLVWCYRELDRLPEAGEEFLLLVRSDPETLYFDSIPLAWVPSQPSPSLEQAARTWFARDDLPAAVLLGASHLMTTPSRPAAVARLAELAGDGDPRIAALAMAQGWRAAVATTGPERLAGWQQAIERMPEPQRPGPCYVLGQAMALHERWEESALAMMRIPILYSQHRGLAARSLLEAGGSLEKIGRPKQAASLYRELMEDYPGSPPTEEARVRLEEMTQKEG